MNYFGEGFLEFTVNCGKLLGISVSFMNWNEDFVNLVDCFVHASLQNSVNVRRVYRSIKKPDMQQPEYNMLLKCLYYNNEIKTLAWDYLVTVMEQVMHDISISRVLDLCKCTFCQKFARLHASKANLN